MPLIRRLSLLEGAADATGFALIIDVFRAGTFACHALGLGARRIVPAASLDEARRLKRDHPDWLLAGERRGIPPLDFDMGNSPFLLRSAPVAGRTIIHATSAGTRGVVSAAGSSDRVCMACFANAGAAVRYCGNVECQTVSLVSMGCDGITRAPEDELCAEFLELMIEGGKPSFGLYVSRILESGAGRRFIESTNPCMPRQDLEECLTLDSVDLVPVLVKSDEAPPAFESASSPGWNGS